MRHHLVAGIYVEKAEADAGRVLGPMILIDQLPERADHLSAVAAEADYQMIGH